MTQTAAEKPVDRREVASSENKNIFF